MSAEVLIDDADGVRIITINRPQAKNAINLAVCEGIAAAMDELEARDDLRVAIITGAGGSFCSGMDLKAFVRGERPFLEGRGFAGFVERPPGKPLIAAVEGYALAGGFEIALASDLIVAASNAFFGIPEVKRGLVAAAGGLMRLPRQLPQRIAMELALTGNMFPARRAFELGLVNRLTEANGAIDEARRLAAEIVANGPLAVAASKRIIQESADWPVKELFARQAPLADPVLASTDAQEGATAFAEKRPPRWQGK
ncbi:MAG TPA: crotonase/enoyl-CoA hydratase family protein [Noviherbaspirillum sp.]|uniref:crotonase/enoyl-CoA hydratase family protein n=1 Tax=Noviherbaspirillum sp. TaxID=1926288 RepID=UPI002B48308F|nr:crotonase/enoyl-CoA hydratase family protein [Noviherbaspirillum sp.]HJV87762.1 crotonase/enoyl-CoA hydratase family protein [Noviherbaspirillum sp.]